MIVTTIAIIYVCAFFNIYSSLKNPNTHKVRAK